MSITRSDPGAGPSPSPAPGPTAGPDPAGPSPSPAPGPTAGPDPAGPSPSSAPGPEPAGPAHPCPGNLEPPALRDVTSSAASRPLRRSVGFRISTLGYEIARRFRGMLGPLGLEPREFGLLRAVAADEGRSQQAIGARLGIGPSRMVGFVDALEARGLLERRLNADDRRTRALHLTDGGRDVLGRAVALTEIHERNLCADLSAAQRDQLLDLLQRVGLRLDLPPEDVHSAMADE